MSYIVSYRETATGNILWTQETPDEELALGILIGGLCSTMLILHQDMHALDLYGYEYIRPNGPTEWFSATSISDYPEILRTKAQWLCEQIPPHNTLELMNNGDMGIWLQYYEGTNPKCMFVTFRTESFIAGLLSMITHFRVPYASIIKYQPIMKSAPGEVSNVEITGYSLPTLPQESRQIEEELASDEEDYIRHSRDVDEIEDTVKEAIMFRVVNIASDILKLQDRRSNKRLVVSKIKELSDDVKELQRLVL